MGRVDLKGRHVLVTGAAGGIGSALCGLLAREGVARLILVDRDLAGLQRLKHDLEPLEVSLVEADLASRAALTDLVAGLRGQRLDGLINNAGVAPGGSFASMEVGAIEAALATNLTATIFLTHHLLPALFASDGAFIVNVASGAGLLAPGGMTAYAASKFGVVGFSEALRAELRSAGVGVSVVCPPFVRTNIVRNSQATAGTPTDDEVARQERLHQMVQRQGLSPERVAARIVRAAQRNQGRVVLGALPRFLLGVRAFFPRAADWLNHLNFKKMKHDGLLR